MITYKPIIIQGGRRRDGTWPVKIRVTFKGVSRRLPTTLVCTDADLTRSGRIKNATVLERAGELIARMRAACDTLSPFTLEAWTVDQVVQHIRDTLTAQAFRLDFFEFADELLKDKIPHTRNYYYTALNAMARYIGERRLDVNDITRAMLLDFAGSEAVGGEWKAARHLAKLSYIFREARNRYNDEDRGAILIPRMPFTGMPRIRSLGKGQKAIPADVFQRLIDAEPVDELERISIAAFLVSFGTMGANMADLYEAPSFKGQIWAYNRHKTRTVREDHAEARVRVEDEIGPFLAVLGAGRRGPLWLPVLQEHWKMPDTATHSVNKFLRRWAEREGVEPFTFYAARKAWATIARRIGVEKATVDEGLVHLGDFRLADIYAERNWSLAWEANRRVLATLRWDRTTIGQKKKTQNSDQ